MAIFGAIATGLGLAKGVASLFGGGKSRSASGGGDSLMYEALQRLKRQRDKEEELARLRAATGPSATGRDRL